MQKSEIEEGEIYAVSHKNKQGSYNVYGQKGNYGFPARVMEIDPSASSMEERGRYYRKSVGRWSSKRVGDEEGEKVSSMSGNGTQILIKAYPEETAGQDEHRDKDSHYKIVHASNVKMEWEDARERVQQYRERQRKREEEKQRKREVFEEAVETIKENIDGDFEEFAIINKDRQKLRPSYGTEDRERFMEALPYDTEIVEASSLSASDITFDFDGTKQLAQKLS